MAEENNEVNQWEPLVADADYEILTEEPHTIRRIDNKFIPIISDNGKGYLYILLKRKPHYIHRLIAQQFLTNPDNFPE
ncbi:MAG: hypothetical protein EZS28_027059, partial [Streblomastix strix]